MTPEPENHKLNIIVMAVLIVLILAIEVFGGWVEYPPIRSGGSVDVVSDVESRLPPGHPYSDPDRITWTHEGTHGINSLMRQQYGQPAFYVLDGGVMLLKEPSCTLADVARSVPQELRGEVYQLYLINAQLDWNQQPSYVFDEWVAYTNGSVARAVLGIRDRQESVRYMVEFCIYSICVEKASKSSDKDVREFILWQLYRCKVVSDFSGVAVTGPQRKFIEDYLASIRSPLRNSAPQSVQIVAFTAKWCKYCPAAHAILERLLASGFYVRELDVDKWPDLAKDWKVDSVPLFFIRDAAGKITRTSDTKDLLKLLEE